LKIIEKYYTKGSDIYNILLIHSEQVRNKAVEIANKKPELKLDIDFIAEAAMLHDIGIFMCNAPVLHCPGHAPIHRAWISRSGFTQSRRFAAARPCLRAAYGSRFHKRNDYSG